MPHLVSTNDGLASSSLVQRSIRIVSQCVADSLLRGDGCECRVAQHSLPRVMARHHGQWLGGVRTAFVFG